MLLYILSLFTISLSSSSSNNIECGSIIWQNDYGDYLGLPLGVCQVVSGNSYKYVCDGIGPIVNEVHYTTTDCSGNISYSNNDFCLIYIDPNYCKTICDTNSCNNFITKTYYNSSDCSGNDILSRDIELKDGCLGSSSSTYKYSCNGTEIIQFNRYSNGDCSGNTQPENTYNTSCISKSDGTSYKWDGCGDNQHDYCSRFKLFIAIIIVFIHVIHQILF